MGVTACLLRNCLQWPHKRDFLDESDSEVGSYPSSHPTDADCRKFLYNHLGLAGGIWFGDLFHYKPVVIFTFSDNISHNISQFISLY